MEETLKLILNRLDSMDTKLASLEQGQQELRAEVDDLKTGQTSLMIGQDSLKTGQESLKTELAEFKTETNKNFENLSKQVDLTATHIMRHTKKLEKISTDIGFLIQKDFETQKEIFFLKQNMKVSGD